MEKKEKEIDAECGSYQDVAMVYISCYWGTKGHGSFTTIKCNFFCEETINKNQKRLIGDLETNVIYGLKGAPSQY